MVMDKECARLLGVYSSMDAIEYLDRKRQEMVRDATSLELKNSPGQRPQNDLPRTIITYRKS